MKTVLISVPLGHYARNLLRTGLLDHLSASGTEVVIATPAYQEPSFVTEFSQNGLGHKVHFAPLYPIREEKRLWERILWKGYITVMPHRGLFLPLMTLNHRLYSGLEPRRYDAFFESYKPELLVTASPGFHSARDIPLIREAQNRKIRTLCAVFGWDNLTTKGIFPTRPDFLAVWNERMVEEAVRIHHYSRDHVFIVGPTAFDIYQDPAIYLSKEMFCGKLRLDPQKKMITVTTASAAVFDDRYILRMLLRFAKNGLFKHPAQILCRVHPQDQRDLYQEFEGNEYIHLDYPGRYSNFLKWDPDREEMVHLANTLRHSDVVINIASTTTIEAALLNRPVINIGFCEEDPHRFESRIKRDHYGKHYRHILEQGGVWHVQSESELLRAVNTYLKDPSLHGEERGRMAEDLCYRLDGKATERLATLMERLVR